MKLFLIILNTILAAVLVLGVVHNIRGKLAENALPEVKKVKQQKTLAKIVDKLNRLEKAEVPVPAENQEARIKKIAENNIFNTNRSPNANIRGQRVELTLVGTFTIGKISGAIIKHKVQQNNRTNMFGMMRGMMPPPGMGPGMNPGMQQRDTSGGRRNSGRSTRNNSNLSGSGGGASRNRFPGGMGGGMMPPPGMMPGMFTGMNQSQSTAAQNYKQYVRVGETLSNGYTLIEVTRTTATLTRGSDKLELEIQEASKGVNIARSGSSNRKQTTQQVLQQGLQQMQNIMRQQGMQQNFMMRQMMNRNMGGGNQRGGPARR